MNVQTIKDNYGKIEKPIRIFTLAYLATLIGSIVAVAMEVVKLNEYIFFDSMGEGAITCGTLALVGCGAMLPSLILMPLSRYALLQDGIKYIIYFINFAVGYTLLIIDASCFEDYGYSTEIPLLMSNHLDSVLQIFGVFCVVIPILLHQLKLYSKEWVCQTKT